MPTRTAERMEFLAPLMDNFRRSSMLQDVATKAGSKGRRKGLLPTWETRAFLAMTCHSLLNPHVG